MKHTNPELPGAVDADGNPVARGDATDTAELARRAAAVTSPAGGGGAVPGVDRGDWTGGDGRPPLVRSRAGKIVLGAVVAALTIAVLTPMVVVLFGALAGTGPAVTP